MSSSAYNDVHLLRGKGTGTGRVTIQGFSSGSGSTAWGDMPPQYMVKVDNYAGRLFYGGGMMLDWNNKFPVAFNQSGSNPIDMILMGNSYTLGVKYTVGPSANLISTMNVDLNPYPGRDIDQIPDPLRAGDPFRSRRPSITCASWRRSICRSSTALETDGPPIAQYPFEGNALDMSGKYNGTPHDISYVPGSDRRRPLSTERVPISKFPIRPSTAFPSRCGFARRTTAKLAKGPREIAAFWTDWPRAPILG